MLNIRAAQLKSLNDHAMRKFAGDIRPTLVRKYPHCLPFFPRKVQEQIVLNMLGRARRWGITWQTALLAYAEMMLSVAPNFDELREVGIALNLEWLDSNRAMLSLSPEVTSDAWRSAAIPKNDLPLFVAAEQIGSSQRDQTAAAMPIALGDKIDGADPLRLADSALALASSLKLDSIPDSGLVVAAWRLFYGTNFRDQSTFPWLADVFEKKRLPVEAVAMLKLQINQDHHRFI